MDSWEPKIQISLTITTIAALSQTVSIQTQTWTSCPIRIASTPTLECLITMLVEAVWETTTGKITVISKTRAHSTMARVWMSRVFLDRRQCQQFPVWCLLAAMSIMPTPLAIKIHSFLSLIQVLIHGSTLVQFLSLTNYSTAKIDHSYLILSNFT